MLSDRQQQILERIVEQFITTAQAVSSDVLADALGVSSATIRNDMATMTEGGFLAQPHTSAGRIPSEDGWRYYIDTFVDYEHKPIKKHQTMLADALADAEDNRDQGKSLAKAIAEISGNAVLVGFGPRDIYYTGLTNLFSQPEFQQLQSVVQISHVIDHLDEMLAGIFIKTNGIFVAVGEDNPFSSECGTVYGDIARTQEKWLMAILGPMRMDYTYCHALLRYTKELLA